MLTGRRREIHNPLLSGLAVWGANEVAAILLARTSAIPDYLTPSLVAAGMGVLAAIIDPPLRDWPRTQAEFDAMLQDYRNTDYTRSGAAITPDTTLIVFHGTQREDRDRFLAEGSHPETKPTNLAMLRYERGEAAEFAPGRGLERGLYVAGDPNDASGFGRYMVAVRVLAGDLEQPVESTAPNVLRGLRGADGAVINKPLPASHFRAYGKRWGYIPTTDISEFV